MPTVQQNNRKPTVPRINVTGLLACSAEREQWDKLVDDIGRMMYACGFADGQRAASDAWGSRPKHIVRYGPSHAELERRRWGDGGREHFGDPRPGDYPGRGE